jgi:putative DNA primase/helicase
MGEAFDRVVSAFRDNGLTVVERGGDRAEAQAPGHSGADRSVSLRSIEGRVLMYCHAGEQLDDVLAELGLQTRDLFDSPKGSTYEYPDGRHVHRSPDKRFRQSGNTKGRSLFRADRVTEVDTVFVVEGEQDVHAVESAGGVAVCSAQGAGKAHLFDWEPLRGRKVVVVRDRDEPGHKHAAQVAELLDGVAASVRIVEAKTGKDAADHLTAGHTLDEFVDVEADLPSGEQRAGEERLLGGDLRPVYPSPGAPLDVARKLFARYRTDTGLRTLLSWRGGWQRWDRTHWAELDMAKLRAEIYDVLGEVDYMRPIREKGVVVDYERTPWDPNKRKIADVIEAMAAVGHLSGNVDSPAWIEGTDSRTPAAQMIACTNGLLDLSTRTLVEHTPALFNTVSVPFDYQPDTPEPAVWLEFLASVWPGDETSIALLQEFFGYILSGRTDMQKLLLLIGPTRSGKGTIARLLVHLIGRGNVAGPTLASLSTNFGLAPLLGKPLAIIADARLGNTPGHTVVERLLSITGEDMLTVDRKFREPWSGRLSTRLTILSNELPRFRDASAAIANRMLILQMHHSFLGREDRSLDRRLSEELPGILNWALEGLDRLTRTGRFTVPASSDDAARLMMDLASPVAAFVRECCVREPDAMVPRDHLYDAWRRWAEDNGHHAGAKSSFGRDLRAVVPDLRDSQPRTTDGRVRCYERIRLRGYTDNGPSPVPPVPQAESAGQAVFSGTGQPVPLDSADVGAECPTLPGTEHPVPRNDSKPQVNGTGTGGTGATPLKPQVETHATVRPIVTGPGRCHECGCHVELQGHKADCSAGVA